MPSTATVFSAMVVASPITVQTHRARGVSYRRGGRAHAAIRARKRGARALQDPRVVHTAESDVLDEI